MQEHRITVDVGDNGDDSLAFKAFCECGWCGERWHHSDEYSSGDFETDPSYAIDEANAAATREGAEHHREATRPAEKILLTIQVEADVQSYREEYHQDLTPEQVRQMISGDAEVLLNDHFHVTGVTAKARAVSA